MANKARPCRGAGGRQGVWELFRGQRSLSAAARRLEGMSPREILPSLWHKRLPVDVLLSRAPRGASTPESRGQAGYFRARRLGGGAGAAGSARMASPLPACSGALPSPAQCAQLFGGERKCTRQPVMRGGPFIPRLVPRRERERSLEIPWDSIRSRVGIALCRMKAPFQSSADLICFNFTQHLSPGKGHLRTLLQVVPGLSLTFHLPLPVFPCLPKSPPTPPRRYVLAPAPAPRRSLPTEVSAALPGVDLRRRAGAGGGEDRAGTTVPPAGHRGRPSLTPSPHGHTTAY